MLKFNHRDVGIMGAVSILVGILLIGVAWNLVSGWSLLWFVVGGYLIYRGMPLVVASVRTHSLLKRIEAIAATHMEVLMRKRQTLRTTDDYGRVMIARWNKELEYFLDHVVTESLSVAHRESLDRVLSNESNREELIAALDKMVAESRRTDGEEILQFREGMEPLEYEHFCAQLLRGAGWSARVTQASGDQGVDVIAEKDGKQMALQCKLYSSPVGNKAVQEAHAGRTFTKADYAAVVTNHSFTTSARELAAASAVLLLHHDDLSNLDSRLAVSPCASS